MFCRPVLTRVPAEPGYPVVRAKQRSRLPPPPLQPGLRRVDGGDEHIIITLLLSVPPPRLLLPLPLGLPVPLPGLLPGCRGDWLDGVGGERPHVADGVQQVGPGHQLGGDLRAAGLETLPTRICCYEENEYMIIRWILWCTFKYP